MSATILVACIGNIFLGDDGFGVEVASAVLRRKLPENVTVKDFGIRGFDLAYALLESWEAVILVDALSRGGTPGTLYLVEPDIAGLSSAGAPDMAMNLHGMDPVRVLHLAASMGPIAARVFVVGCEPMDFGDELEGRMGLSMPVQAAVGGACAMMSDLIERLRGARQAPGRIERQPLHTAER